jgi:enoyl-CoA hydratase/carnithine racemase
MPDIEVGLADATLEVRFNRPCKKNAITNVMYRDIADALERAQSDDAIRAILFTAAGDYFCAGNDVAEFASIASGEDKEPRHVGRFLENLISAEKPIVAAVQGHAVGVGVTMLMHCDLVYVAETAKLTTPFVDLGLVPEAASSITIPARLGHARAFAMLGLGEPLLGADAARTGFATASLPVSEVDPRARAATTALVAKPPEALRLAKGLMRDRVTLDARMREENVLFDQRLKSAEAKAAFASFLGKRQ